MPSYKSPIGVNPNEKAFSEKDYEIIYKKTPNTFYLKVYFSPPSALLIGSLSLSFTVSMGAMEPG